MPQRSEPALTLAALFLLLVLPVAVLDQRELSPSEAAFATRVAGVGNLAPADRTPAERLWSFWGELVGTTERMQRGLVILFLLASALLLGEVLAARGATIGRALAWALLAASPGHARGELLDPVLLGVFPHALVVAASLPGSRAVERTLAAVAGGFGLALLAPGTGWLALLAGTWVSGRQVGPVRWWVPAGLLLGAGLGGLLLVVQGEPLPVRLPAELPVDAARAGAFGLALALLCSRGGRARNAVLLAVIGVMGAGLVGPGELAVFALPWAACLLPSGGPPTARSRAWAAVIVLGVVGGLTAHRERDASPQNPARRVLEEARAAAEPGGRLVASGPLRFALRYYARRGQDPGVPILLLPEDLSEADLRAQMRARVGAGPATPRILLHPAREVVPEGFEREAGGSERLQLLRLLTR